MKMGKVSNIGAALASAAWIAMLAGCNTAGCIDNLNSIPVAGFYSMGSGDAVTIDSLAVWGVGARGDSLLLSPQSGASQLYLPLRSSATVTSFCFAYKAKALDHPSLNDTVTIAYTARPWFISEDCGAGYRYSIGSVTHTSHLIDSVGVADSLVTNIVSENLRIYFRTTSSSGAGEEPETP